MHDTVRCMSFEDLLKKRLLSVCAICFAMLVDRGLVAYEDQVSKHWPEFGQNGKEDITIEMLLAHQVF
ncbi:unnamed protein product [Gongylonema pulchrum]|uniref:Beta-lactamase domain-containing protein n=1 Tax=Gongylonema pulchrum TaxID=637853 RepID=A0A183DJF2_9BILA|nr:unnamed protein product [Gongylonema pulchrum]